MKRTGSTYALFSAFVVMIGQAAAQQTATDGRSASQPAQGPITIHDDGSITVRVGESRKIMNGVQPFLYDAGNDVLLVQSQLSEKPRRNRERINHFPWQFGNYISRDFGQTWQKYVIRPGVDPPFLEGGGLARPDGSYLLLDTYITPTANPDEGEGDLWISRDAFRTIEDPVRMTFSIPGVDFDATKDDGGHEHRAIRLHRSLLELPNGDFLVSAYGCFKGDATPCPYQPKMMKLRSILFRSCDGGKSWKYISTIAVGNVGSEGFGEPVLCRISRGAHAGRLLCFMRTGCDLHQAISDDEGATWSVAKPVEFPGIDVHDERWQQYVDTSDAYVNRYPVATGAMVDPDLTELDNGILACAVGVRIPEKACFRNPRCPRNGNYLAFSRDQGKTWNHIVQLTSGVWTTHYMAIRQIRPNQLYVAYDLGFWGRPDNQTMGCVVDVALSKSRGPVSGRVP
ncbi:MAG: exo-alpha-sialidase [Phycisphaerae bacterium]|nr:exo-alpha-sialidase [Phycisphaerae bacterium]